MNEQIAQAVKILRSQSAQMGDMIKNNLALADWLEQMKVVEPPESPKE